MSRGLSRWSIGVNLRRFTVATVPGRYLERIRWAGDKAPATWKKPPPGGCTLRSAEIVGVIKRHVAKGRLHCNSVFMEVRVTST